MLDYARLADPSADFSEEIETAYGQNGLGLLVVRGVPNFVKLRGDLLPLAHKFANLPEEVKQKYVHEVSKYSFGWSHGKEKFEGAPDFSKGSYYNNPQYDRPVDDEELIAKYPPFCHPNIWPTADLPELEPAFKALGRLVVEVGTLLAHHCDKFVASRQSGYRPARLENVLKTSRTCKARLLHYFALNREKADAEPSSDTEFSSWCGWHNDHGSLTGLTSAMYLDPSGKEVPNPDPEHAGLYIRSRQGKLTKAVIPADHLAFQIGETAEVHSGGALRATPHCVRGASGPASIGISRETFAVFMEPMWNEPMDLPAGVQPDTLFGSTVHFPPGVPLLSRRWLEGQDFGQFTDATLSAYY